MATVPLWCIIEHVLVSNPQARETEMNRRDLLALMGTSVTASFLQPLSATERLDLGARLQLEIGTASSLSAGSREVVARVADLVLPRTETPGALDVRVPEFVDLLMTKWYSATERADFEKGITDLDKRAGGFVAKPEAAQVAFLTTLDGQKGAKGTAEDAFSTLKWLTIYGYFTSRQVQREVLKTVIMPGRFDGCVPVKH